MMAKLIRWALGRDRELLGAVAFVAVISLLAYGPFLGGLGFYRDDWYILWAGDTFGPSAIVKLLAIDRPLMGHVYAWIYRLVGDRPLPWQLLALSLRTAGGLILLWLLRRMFPARRKESTLAAALLVVYPGFLQLPNALTYSHHLIGYGLGLLSIALFYEAVVRRGWRSGFLTLLSLAAAVACWNIMEYMVGLEGLRAGVAIVAAARPRPQGWRTIAAASIRRLWPFWLAAAAYLYWRLFIFQSLRPAVSAERLIGVYQADFARTILRTALDFGVDLVETVFFGWIVPTYQFVSSAEYRDLTVSVLVALGAVAILAAYLAWAKIGKSAGGDEAEEGSWGKAWMLMGGLAVATSLLPVSLAQRDVHWNSGFDRYSLPATAGIAVFIVGLIWTYVRTSFRSVFVGSLLLLSIVTHFHNGLHWKDFWDVESEIWWQLAWRAPQLKPGTILLVQLPVDGFYEDYEAWGPANLLFYPGSPEIQIGAEVLSEETFDRVRFGVTESRGVRGLVDYERDFASLLLLTMPSEASCLHVLVGPRFELPRGVDPLVQLMAPYSRNDLILVEETSHLPPARIFGDEPAISWCFLYQKASLARQRGNWDEVSRLGDLAFELDLKPSDRSEWTPFLEAYVTLGHTTRATEIADLIKDREPIRHSLCDELANERPTNAASHRELMRLICD